MRFSLPAGSTVDDLPGELAAARLPDHDPAGSPRVHLAVSSVAGPVGALCAWAAARGADLPDLEVRRPTLEDVYLELTEPRR